MKETKRGRVQEGNHKASPAEQFQRFKEAARELGTDESEEAFDKVLGKIASAPPPKSVQKRKRQAAGTRKK